MTTTTENTQVNGIDVDAVDPSYRSHSRGSRQGPNSVAGDFALALELEPLRHHSELFRHFSTPLEAASGAEIVLEAVSTTVI